MENENEFKTGTIATHNGTITVTNTATGDHRTFAIRTQPNDARFAPGKRIVSLFVGRDNDNPFDYNGFGFVNDDGTIRVWRKKSGGVFDTYARMLAAPESFMARGVEYVFAGTCRVCNRTLTNPESIASGIGPVCAERLGMRREPSTTELRNADVRGVGIDPAFPKRPEPTVDDVATSPAGWRAPERAVAVNEFGGPVDLRESPAFWRLFG